MPKTGFFSKKPVLVVFGHILPKLNFHKYDPFYIWSNAARRADSEYHFSFSSKHNMEV